ncbi:unnamed protein product [Euphydryas editha]|uniref:Uncharacterized protein n=1 Tax=Euphydryas editha TaxID=104508 RepID=A0AAU9TMI9_EUPED|nr:unnamed protein product [Euphydryas editha]
MAQTVRKELRHHPLEEIGWHRLRNGGALISQPDTSFAIGTLVWVSVETHKQILPANVLRLVDSELQGLFHLVLGTPQLMLQGWTRSI